MNTNLYLDRKKAKKKKITFKKVVKRTRKKFVRMN